MCVVAAALRSADGRWLLHRRPAHKHHGGLWEFPGGKVEADETPGSALVRELEEELGVSVRADSAIPLAFAQERPNGADRWTVILLYTVSEWEGEPRALDEGAAIGWFTPEEIAALDRPPLDIDLCNQLFSSGRIGRGG